MQKSHGISLVIYKTANALLSQQGNFGYLRLRSLIQLSFILH
jgi:hypothetical protein